jgi:hypothetical protein
MVLLLLANAGECDQLKLSDGKDPVKLLEDLNIGHTLLLSVDK